MIATEGVAVWQSIGIVAGGLVGGAIGLTALAKIPGGRWLYRHLVAEPISEIVHAAVDERVDETVERVRDFADSCGKDPVIVKDQAGFIVNALLFPYLNNAVRLLEHRELWCSQQSRVGTLMVLSLNPICGCSVDDRLCP